MGMSGQSHAPAAYPQARDPAPIVQEAGWAPGPVNKIQKAKVYCGCHIK